MITWQIVVGVIVFCYAVFVILLYFGMFGRAKEADGLGERLINKMVDKLEIEGRLEQIERTK